MKNDKLQKYTGFVWLWKKIGEKENAKKEMRKKKENKKENIFSSCVWLERKKGRKKI